jgi:hypothetical protein
MTEMEKLRRCVLIFAVAVFALPLQGGMVKVREFSLATQRGSGAYFGAAATPSGNVLTFIARDSGVWELHRVRSWLAGPPADDILPLPGYFSAKDKPDREGMGAQVLVTGDGRYAVCVGSAYWLKRDGGVPVGDPSADDVISVVDLKTFGVVATARTSGLGLLGAHDVTLDREGRLRVSGDSMRPPRRGAFVQLSLPSLTPGPRCSYNWIADSPGKEHPDPTTESECNESLGEMTIDAYFSEDTSSYIEPHTLCEGNSAEFCRLPVQGFTTDGKFGVADREEGHDVLFGGYETTSLSYVVFSVAERADTGEIKLPTDHSAKMVLASLSGRDFLLLIREGTVFTVYQLQD